MSIIIPCYNSEFTILRTLESVINQTYQHYEIIIIDDGSVDQTRSVVEEFFEGQKQSYQYLYQENTGPSAARNKGIKNSKGEYIAFLDADDVWHPEKLELCLKVFETQPIGVLGHTYSLSDNFGRRYYGETIEKISSLNLLLKNFAVTPSIIVKREAMQLFDETMKYAEDHELWLRISFINQVGLLDLPLVKLGRKPLSDGGLSSNRWAMRKGELRMYFKASKYKKYLFSILPLLFLFSLAKHLRNIIKGGF
ncbi:glycosyltransferase family 2 protein [Sulfurospirillum sp. SCADC]|uniref:glycosyltransferase family 2 protein n=1 Tax=Sulfurospirillum sp. SCADC TaxID=1537915 RepID=UPI0025E904AA|nr:glycosyltransferase family 2 protein [Sulfurospirillum sp. SCADC]